MKSFCIQAVFHEKSISMLLIGYTDYLNFENSVLATVEQLQYMLLV